MKIIRYLLGKIVLFLNALFVPALEVHRSPEQQAKVDAETSSWVLYQLVTCPFCVKVRREMKRLGITIQTRDISSDANAYAELMAGGKIDQYPCLRMGDTWMYESSAIVEFLQKGFKTS
jgi:glutaredoxin